MSFLVFVRGINFRIPCAYEPTKNGKGNGVLGPGSETNTIFTFAIPTVLLWLVCCGDPWSWALEVYSLDCVPDSDGLVDEITKVLPGHFALSTNLSCLFSLRAKSLDRALQTDTEIIGWVTQDFTDFWGYSIRVCMDIIDWCKLGADLGWQALRKWVGDLRKDIVGSSEY